MTLPTTNLAPGSPPETGASQTGAETWGSVNALDAAAGGGLDPATRPAFELEAP